MTMSSRIPGYEPMLAAYHRAFASELRGIVHSLPIASGQTVLDMACGDGAYGPWLAECVGPDGRVVAVDKDPDYLKLARSGAAAISEFVCAPHRCVAFPGRHVRSLLVREAFTASPTRSRPCVTCSA
jgi:ubiquinone/menaquinone biosynthesis C-methylase UbiE